MCEHFCFVTLPAISSLTGYSSWWSTSIQVWISRVESICSVSLWLSRHYFDIYYNFSLQLFFTIFIDQTFYHHVSYDSHVYPCKCYWNKQSNNIQVTKQNGLWSYIWLPIWHFHSDYGAVEWWENINGAIFTKLPLVDRGNVGITVCELHSETNWFEVASLGHRSLTV